jgi:MFS transporter, DHA1 family, inner membrane transport protein
MLGHFTLIPYIAPSLVQNVGFSPDNIFLIYFVGGALTIFFSPLVGRLADKQGKYPVFVVFGFLSLIPVWLITNLWPMPLWGVLTVAGMFFIFVNGRMIPMQAMTSAVVTPQQRGSFMGINSSLTQLASGVAANIGGALVWEAPNGRLENYPLVGYFSMFMILVCMALAKQLKAVG